MGLIIIETDNAVMANVLRGNDIYRSEWFWLVSEIKEAMLAFVSVQIKSVKRQQNSLAHELPARARRLVDCRLTVDVPVALRPLMLSEYTK